MQISSSLKYLYIFGGSGLLCGAAAARSRRLCWLVTRGASTSQLCAQETTLRKVVWGEGENNLFTITF